ncbi:hypothetical protein SAMD00079811_39420 [Scytonema sp. HK-05]|nr:hypothetical protein SAMD00079811_39420 [Scytonema sp. HK-05]
MQLCFRCKQRDISSVGEDGVMFQVGAQHCCAPTNDL